MLKRHAIIKFVLTIIIAILGILLCILPFGVPYSSKQYNGFLNAINKDIDLDGGISAIYTCNLKNTADGDLSKTIDSSISTIEDMFKQERFRQLIIERQGGNKINIKTSSDAYEMNKAFYYITDGKELLFTTTQVSDTDSLPNVYLNSDDINTVKINYDYDSSQYGVEITLKKSSSKRISVIKSIAQQTSAQNIYLYLDELNSKNLLTEISYKDISKDTIFLTSSSSSSFSTSTAEGAREIAYNIVGGMLDINLKLLDVSPISPVLGKNTQLYIGICLLLTIFLTFAFLIIRYGDLGLLASLALTFYAILFAFFMQAIPFINLSLSGVIGSVIAFLFAALSCAIIFENIKSEYAIGKKIHLSFKGGFKKSLWTILDMHAILILSSIFIWVIAPSLMKCFGITLILGALLSAFTALVCLRGLANNYLVLNSTKAKRLKLYRDKSVKELSTIESERATENTLASEEITKSQEVEVEVSEQELESEAEKSEPEVVVETENDENTTEEVDND